MTDTTIPEIKTTAEQKMARSIETFKGELHKIRTGRAHPGLLDQVHVEYYGSMVPISQVANVTLLDARTISVQPWEKGLAGKIERAIRESDLGLNPASQGDLLRVPMPALTEERRKELTKVVRPAQAPGTVTGEPVLSGRVIVGTISPRFPTITPAGTSGARASSSAPSARWPASVPASRAAIVGSKNRLAPAPASAAMPAISRIRMLAPPETCFVTARLRWPA